MPSVAASRRAAALSPIARIADGGGPTQRIPAASTSSANSAFSARNPKPGWRASAPAARAAATTAAGSSRSRPSGPSVTGMTARMPSRSQVRVIRRGDLAAVRDEDRPDRRRARRAPRAVARRGAVERVNCVKRDTPSPTDATRGQPPARDPALDGPRRRPEPPGDLLRAQLVGHRVVSVALVPTRRQRSRALSADEADHDGGCQDDGDRCRQLLNRDPEADTQRDRVRPERPRGLREGRTPRPTRFDVQPRLREGGRRSAGSGARHPPAPRSPRGWRPCRRRRSPGLETRTASSSSPAASVASLGTYRSRAALAAATSPVMNRALARSRPLASAFEGSVSHCCALTASPGSGRASSALRCSMAT